jgi:hypothetical protein
VYSCPSENIKREIIGSDNKEDHALFANGGLLPRM